jgi:hypothetical protein
VPESLSSPSFATTRDHDLTSIIGGVEGIFGPNRCLIGTGKTHYLESGRVPFLDWSLIIMKSFLYRAGSTLLCALAVIAIGCQEDNEAAIKQQEAKSSAAQVKTTEPPPKTQAEYGQRNAAMKTKGYPGTKQ